MARRLVVLSIFLVLVVLGGCRSVDPGATSASLSATTPTPTPSVPDFGDLAALQETLGSAGFRAGLSPQGYVTLTSGPSVTVTLMPSRNEIGQFQAVSLEVAPLSALEDDPTAMPAVELVLELFDSWSPQAADRARKSLQDARMTSSRPGATERDQRSEAQVDDGFALITELSYGGATVEDDYLRLTLMRD